MVITAATNSAPPLSLSLSQIHTTSNTLRNTRWHSQTHNKFSVLLKSFLTFSSHKEQKGHFQQRASEYLGKLAFINSICKRCLSSLCKRSHKWTSVITISNLTDPSHSFSFSLWMIPAMLLCLGSDSKLFSLTGIIVLLKPVNYCDGKIWIGHYRDGNWRDVCNHPRHY